MKYEATRLLMLKRVGTSAGEADAIESSYAKAFARLAMAVAPTRADLRRYGTTKEYPVES